MALIANRQLANPDHPIGGSVHAERYFFRCFDMVSYLFYRTGHVEWREIEENLPGWHGEFSAVQRSRYRLFSVLRDTLGLRIDTVADADGYSAYVHRKHDLSPLAAYARGYASAPQDLRPAPRANWSAVHTMHHASAIFRTLGEAPRRTRLSVDDIQPAWPLTPTDVHQFVTRWRARTDFSAFHHQAVRFLMLNERSMTLDTLWPKARVQLRAA